MTLPNPEIPTLKSYPQGADPAAIFPEGLLTLTYWDLWCLLSAKHRFGSDISALRRSLVDRRMNSRFHSWSRKEMVEDLIALLDDLAPRIKSAGSVDEILAVIPERLLKKETQKGIKNITDDWGTYYPPSAPMLRSPRRMLKTEAMRGMWARLPFDPTPIAEALRPVFIPKKKPGYFPKGSTFALGRRVEKAVNKELANADGLFVNRRAYRYAVHRAALTLFHEEHHWDDSYGVMGEIGKTWINKILALTADDTCADPHVFLKDLMMFFCWEDYGLSDEKEIAGYVGRLDGRRKDFALSQKIDSFISEAYSNDPLFEALEAWLIDRDTEKFLKASEMARNAGTY